MMSVIYTFKPNVKSTSDNVIDLSNIMKSLKKDSEVEIKYNRDGSIDKRRCNKVAGVSSEVYPFYEDEIKNLITLFDKRIDEAKDANKRQIASRNKMLFIVGINLSLRASDLCGLTYKFFFKEDGTFKDFYSLQPKKTKKTGKYVKLFFNESVKKAITDYIEQYPMEDMNEYLFKSREGNGHITTIHLGRIIKTAAAEVGIDKNICSHSLRKTFGYHVWHNAEDKEKSLIILQTIFNHSSPMMTKKYIGLMDDEIEDVFNNLNLGIDYI